MLYFKAINAKKRGVEAFHDLGLSLMVRLQKPPLRRTTPEIAKFHVEVKLIVANIFVHEMT